mmetsp:Transcript_12488/g.29791  ORF Transcript_12488/g.29791 Transcript_12488/m.29791 type:complete len:107 (-) Transcript_12488:3190-3510(-)
MAQKKSGVEIIRFFKIYLFPRSVECNSRSSTNPSPTMFLNRSHQVEPKGAASTISRSSVAGVIVNFIFMRDSDGGCNSSGNRLGHSINDIHFENTKLRSRGENSSP